MSDAALPEADPNRAVRALILFGLVLVFVFSAGLVGWAAVAMIQGAVVAHGRVVVENNVKRVQHPDGGIVAEIMVRDGSHVKAGEPLVRMDETATRAELGIVMANLVGARARLARLTAERDGLDAVDMPRQLAPRADDRDVGEAMWGERNLFEARRKARLGEIAQLRERVDQIRQEITGIEAQLAAIVQQLKVSREELADVEPLWRKGLTTLSRVNQLKRQITALEGQQGELVATAARARTRIAETELQITQVEKAFATEVARDLREVQDRVGELDERRIAAEARLSRVIVKAPIAGVVHQLAVHTIGGVIGAGDAILVIVPEQEKLIVDAQFDPSFIDQVHIGQTAVVRFPALDQRITPELRGEVSFVSPDVEVDQRTGVTYYRARIGFPPEEVAKIGALRMTSGMPAEAYIQTRERTVLSYLFKPLTDQVTRAFRER